MYTVAADVPTTPEVGLKLFLGKVLHHQVIPVQDQIVSAILGQIHVERDGFTINRTAVKECVDIYLQLEDEETAKKVYHLDIEPIFLAETRKFYALEAQKLLETCDAAEYLRRVSSIKQCESLSILMSHRRRLG